MKNPAPAAPGPSGRARIRLRVTTEPRPDAWPGKNWTGLLGDAASTVTSSLADEGARAAVTIRQQHPDVGVLLLSQVIEATFAMRLFSESPAGFGYLLKDRILDVDFVDAVRRVGRGGTAVDPKVVSQLLRRVRPDERLASLTDRERSVLELMAEGRSKRTSTRSSRSSTSCSRPTTTGGCSPSSPSSARSPARRLQARASFVARSGREHLPICRRSEDPA